MKRLVAMVGAALVIAGAAQAQQSTIRYVPAQNVNVLDPVTNVSPSVIQFAYMVYDQLFAVDGELSDDPVLTLPHPRAHERATVHPHVAHVATVAHPCYDESGVAAARQCSRL